jgi:pimeloyl-ACP methyl ester carboxylesterase
LRQDRIIEVSGVKLECAVCGSGDPVVLLANAGCGIGYFDDLASTLAAGGFRAICINMRGVGESCGSLEDATLHDLAADVAGAIEVLGCGAAHLIGHAFGNRIARCLAADCPSLVRKVVVLAAGGLITPSTPLGTGFRNASEVKMNGSDCVASLGARWLSPASDPRILSAVECWPAVHIAHLETCRNVPLDAWWSAGTAPLLVVQGLDDQAAVPSNGHALREQLAERVRVVDLPHAGHFMVLEQPEAVARAVLEFLGVGAVGGYPHLISRGTIISKRGPSR